MTPSIIWFELKFSRIYLESFSDFESAEKVYFEKYKKDKEAEIEDLEFQIKVLREQNEEIIGLMQKSIEESIENKQKNHSNMNFIAELKNL